MFSTNIKRVRLQAKETQRVMAERLGISQRTVASWESGDRMPSYEILLQIASLYQVSTDYLLGRIKQPSVITPLSDQNVMILTSEKGLLTKEKQTLHKQELAGVWRVINIKDINPDQLEALEAYIRQVVRSELRNLEKNS